MNRWGVRILGLLLILFLFLLMANLQRQLVVMQKARSANPATST
jgi:YbbR domain-containing protein